jgi:hypothetical protein
LIAGLDRTPAERELLATGIDAEDRPIVRQARKERPRILAREADGAARSAGASRQRCEHDAEALAFRHRLLLRFGSNTTHFGAHDRVTEQRRGSPV